MTAETVFRYALTAYGQQYADPVQVRRDLLCVSAGRLWDWVAEARSVQETLDTLKGKAPDVDDAEAVERYRAAVGSLTAQLAETEGRIVAAAYHAFGLPKFDRHEGTGVTEEEARGVLVSFLEYAEKKD